jgi:hypothetical protein
MDISEVSLLDFDEYEHDESNEITYHEDQLYHCVPLDDIQEHIESVTCWCRPYPHHEIDTFIIHNRSFDTLQLFTGN